MGVQIVHAVVGRQVTRAPWLKCEMCEDILPAAHVVGHGNAEKYGSRGAGLTKLAFVADGCALPDASRVFTCRIS